MEQINRLANSLRAHQSSGDDESLGKVCGVDGVSIRLDGPACLNGVSKDRSGMEGRGGDKSELSVWIMLTLRNQVGCVDSA